MSTFRRAERKKAKLRAAICGPAGAGKTYSALLLAQGLGGKIALIDTERGSGELYSALCDYDVAQITAPYKPQKYVTLIKEAAQEYDVLIIDSLTHAWAGEGGVLDMHTDATAAQRTKNSYTAWRDVTPAHNALVDAILTAPCHVICSMRSKMAYEQSDSGGKKTVQKLGMAPIQREGMEYEFTLVLDVNQEHYAVSTKDRTQLWDGRGERITIAHGRELRDWLESGVVTETPPPHAPTIGAGSSAHKALEARIGELGLNRDGVKAWCTKNWGVDHLPDLTAPQQRDLLARLPGFAVTKLMRKIPLMNADELNAIINDPPAWLKLLPDIGAVVEAADQQLTTEAEPTA